MMIQINKYAPHARDLLAHFRDLVEILLNELLALDLVRQLLARNAKRIAQFVTTTAKKKR